MALMGQSRWCDLIQDINRGDFTEIEVLLEELDTRLWPMLADHLFNYCDEVDPSALLSWASNRTIIGERVFAEHIIKRLKFGDRVICFHRRFMDPFYARTTSSLELYSAADSTHREQIVCSIMDQFLSDFVENIDYCPVQIASHPNFVVQPVDDVLDDPLIRIILNITVPLMKDPNGADISDVTIEEEATIIMKDCAGVLEDMCAQKKRKRSQQVSQLYDKWSGKLNQEMRDTLNPESVATALRILQAQVKPNEKHVKREEIKFLKYLERIPGHTVQSSPSRKSSALRDSKRSILLKSLSGEVDKSQALIDKIHQTRWKATKVSDRVTLYSSSLTGMSARMDVTLDSEDVISILRSLFNVPLLFAHWDFTDLDTSDTHRRTRFRRNFPFPFSPRECCVYTRIEMLREGEGVLLIDDDEATPPLDGYVRASAYLGGAHVQRQEGSSLVRFLLHCDLGGSVPQWVMNMQTKETFKLFTELASKLAEMK
ncbi:hypothetical protein PROFUN_08538 [Planoprotostelium fungivorum]|uniref:START domain-containing protein n=1 Tax=Planoprotostelium fungivorum TaxID=1890364 RepID=A0A2P6N1L8_9EUKA|nr:hypothetical protein PROFUN_08538 [Planoprotostelium fungivorum]